MHLRHAEHVYRTTSSCSASRLLLSVPACRCRAIQLKWQIQNRIFGIDDVRSGSGVGLAAAAANPSDGQRHSNSNEEQQQQPQQQQQGQMPGASRAQETCIQQDCETQHSQQQQQQKPGRWQKVQGMLQQYGPGAFLSYITCSNLLSVAMLSSAWLLFTRTTGYTPLQAGQWPKFLVFYAGAYAMTHAARPLKLALGLACAPAGTAAVDGVAWALRSSKAVALVVVLVAEAAALLCCLGAVAVYASRLALTLRP